MKTTLQKIRDSHPCELGYRRLHAYLGFEFNREEEFNVAIILQSNDLDDTLWVLVANSCGNQGKKLCVTFAVDVAERVLHLYESKYPEDNRPRKALEVTRSYLKGESTLSQVNDAAARAAANAAGDAAADAAADAYATYAAGDSAYAADAAADAAANAAYAAANAAYAAADAYAADAAAADATYAGEREWQVNHLIELLENFQ